jgi:hypothetical protein
MAPTPATVDLSASPLGSPSGPFQHPRTQQGKLHKGLYSTERVVDPVSPTSARSLSRRPSVSSTDVDDSSEPAPKKAKVTSSSTRERLHIAFLTGSFLSFDDVCPL